MKVRIQVCTKYASDQDLFFRALICGGVLIRTKSGIWSRKDARAMLNALCYEMPNVKRSSIRFKLV